MTESSSLTRREILANVQRLCRSFGRNMAYYRAGWSMELRHLFEANPDSGNFWNTVNGNFLDMCVLDWCKLFGERNGNYSWKRIVADPDAFKRDLLEHLGLDDNAFDEEIRIFREYRDKWVAHLDRDRKGLYPRLDIAKKAVWFYYKRIGNEQVELLLFSICRSSDFSQRAHGHAYGCRWRLRQTCAGEACECRALKIRRLRMKRLGWTLSGKHAGHAHHRSRRERAKFQSRYPLKCYSKFRT